MLPRLAARPWLATSPSLSALTPGFSSPAFIATTPSTSFAPVPSSSSPPPYALASLWPSVARRHRRHLWQDYSPSCHSPLDRGPSPRSPHHHARSYRLTRHEPPRCQSPCARPPGGRTPCRQPPRLCPLACHQRPPPPPPRLHRSCCRYRRRPLECRHHAKIYPPTPRTLPYATETEHARRGASQHIWRRAMPAPRHARPPVQ